MGKTDAAPATQNKILQKPQTDHDETKTKLEQLENGGRGVQKSKMLQKSIREKHGKII